MSATFFQNYFKKINKSTGLVSEERLKKIADLVLATSSASKKIILVGNGGSAAMASHVAVDFTKASKIRAINFNEADLITCFANDYGYENWIVEALKAYADSGDSLFLISSSGQSANIIKGALQAKAMGVNVVALSGFSENNPLRKCADIELWVDSQEYNVVEMTHHIWLLSIVDYICEKKNMDSL